MCHEMARQRIVARCHVVLDDLVAGSATKNGIRRGDGRHTVLKAESMAIHLAFAPVILNSANCKPSRTTTGWMSPLVMAGGFGVPKCENMRKPRGVSSSWTLRCRASLGSPFPGFVAGSFADLLGGPEPLPLTLAFRPWEGPGLAEAGWGVAAFDAAFAARCASCCSRRSALVICFWDFGGVGADGLGEDMSCCGVVSLNDAVRGIVIVAVVVDIVPDV